MDKITPEQRSANMAAIRGKDTAPELAVRRFLHARGLRYRLYGQELPGKPDLVFPGRRAVVFVHGCFWHACPHCASGRRQVRSNADYWEPKRARNKARDAASKEKLEAEGWTVLTVWACQLKDVATLEGLAAELNVSLRPRRAPRRARPPRSALRSRSVSQGSR